MEIRIPLRQHVGKPCTPTVELHDDVSKGQLIAVPSGLGANIHASVSGRVYEVTEHEIVILMDAEQPETYQRIPDSETHLEAIEDAGVVGAGGAGFPTHVKLKNPVRGGTVIINAAECEPILKHNMAVSGDYPERIIRGLKYVMAIVEADHGVIAIKPKNRTAMMALGKACKAETGIDVKYLPEIYPAGDERVIIREIMGVELEPGVLPSAANAVVLNVETVKNITAAIEDRKPVITKDITVGGRVKNAKEGVAFTDVPIGMPVDTYIKQAGGFVVPYGEIVLGGPFTGKAGNTESPVTKTLGGVLVAMPYPTETRKVGIIACECGAQEERLREIAVGMGAEVVAETKCKRMVEVGGRHRCEKPGICPGQTEKVLELKKKGAQVIITGTCED